MVKGVCGAVLGVVFGGMVAGVLSVALACIIEIVDPDQAGLHTIVLMIFGGAAGVAVPGCAIPGAIGAIWRRAFGGMVAASVAGLLPANFFSTQFYLYGDAPDWPVTLLVMGGGPFLGTIVARLAAAHAFAGSGRHLC